MIGMFVVFVCIMIAFSLSKRAREPEPYVVPLEVYNMFPNEDPPPDIMYRLNNGDNTFAGLTVDKMAHASFVLADEATAYFDPSLRDGFQHVISSDFAMHIFLMTRLPSTTLSRMPSDAKVGYMNDVDKYFINVLSSCTSSKFIPVKIDDTLTVDYILDVDYILVHGNNTHANFVSKGYRAMDILLLDKDILRVVSNDTLQLAYHHETKLATLSSKIVLLKKIIEEHFNNRPSRNIHVVHDASVKEVRRRVPKTMAITTSTQMNVGDMIQIVSTSTIGLMGDYYVIGEDKDIYIVSEALVVSIDGVKREDKVVSGRATVDGNITLYEGDVVFDKNLGCYITITNNKNNSISGVVLSCMEEEQNKAIFANDYVCYGNNQIYNEDQCIANGSVMSRPCVYDGECPFFAANATTMRGGCRTGTCEMPIGVENKSHKTFTPDSVPLCYGCKDGTGNCCDDSKKFAFRV